MFVFLLFLVYSYSVFFSCLFIYLFIVSATVCKSHELFSMISVLSNVENNVGKNASKKMLKELNFWTFFLNPRTTRCKSFQTFFVWALLLIVHTRNSSPLRSNFLRLQCTCFTVPTTSGRPHGSPLVWKCQWPSSQPHSSPQLSHNDSLWA